MQPTAASVRRVSTAVPIEEPLCILCGGSIYQIVCPAAEVNAELDYLRGFHLQRLQADAPRRAALEDRSEFTQAEATDIVACPDCGLLFRSPRPTAHSIAQRYARDHYDREFLETSFAGQVPHARRQARALSRWLPKRTGIRIIEVGSFVGSFLAAGQERGWNMLGVDPGLEVSTFCRQRGLPVFRGQLHQAPFEPRSVDAVTIWNTFDQLPDPKPTLSAALELLRPGGILAIRIPNGACFQWAQQRLRHLTRPFAGWLRAALAWNNLLAFPYLYGYSLSTLDRMVCRPSLQRVAARADTLVTLADSHTKRWAAIEEQVLKAMTRRLTSLEHAPWLEVYYRSAG